MFIHIKVVMVSGKSDNIWWRWAQNSKAISLFHCDHHYFETVTLPLKMTIDELVT